MSTPVHSIEDTGQELAVAIELPDVASAADVDLTIAADSLQLSGCG